jgi:hypothetical protein
MIKIPMNNVDLVRPHVEKAFELLPTQMYSRNALALVFATGLQESQFEYRRQIGNGPARGFWQFERGTVASRGGVTGVMLHEASRYWVNHLCKERNVEFTSLAIWNAVGHDDVLAAGLARLLIFTDSKALPTNEKDAWDMYAKRTWRPGKPHPQKWPANYRRAMELAEA